MQKNPTFGIGIGISNDNEENKHLPFIPFNDRWANPQQSPISDCRLSNLPNWVDVGGVAVVAPLGFVPVCQCDGQCGLADRPNANKHSGHDRSRCDALPGEHSSTLRCHCRVTAAQPPGQDQLGGSVQCVLWYAPPPPPSPI